MKPAETPAKPLPEEYSVSEEDLRILQGWITSQRGGGGAGGTYLRNLAKESFGAEGEPIEREVIYGPEVSPNKDKKQRSEEMRKACEAATSLLSEGFPSYKQYALEREATRILKIENIQGGGRGNSAKSRYVAEDIEQAIAPENVRGEHCISYERHGPKGIKLSILGHLAYPTGTVRRGTWTRWYWQGRYILSLLLVGSLFLFVTLTMAFNPEPFSSGHASLILNAIFICSIFYLVTVKPLIKINRYNLTTIDEAYLHGNEPPSLLERKRDPENDSWNMTEICRYSSSCGVCGSDVAVQEGGLEWPGRIIGTCLQNPSEHAYSFDRFGLKGYPLRPGMVGKPEWSS